MKNCLWMYLSLPLFQNIPIRWNYILFLGTHWKYTNKSKEFNTTTYVYKIFRWNSVVWMHGKMLYQFTIRVSDLNSMLFTFMFFENLRLVFHVGVIHEIFEIVANIWQLLSCEFRLDIEAWDIFKRQLIVQ